MSFESTWLSDWSKRIEITIDHTKVDSDLTDFPLFLNIRNTAGIDDADPMQDFKDELSISDYDFSDDFTDGYNTKKWYASTPSGATVTVSGNKLIVTATTAGADVNPWVSSDNRWWFRGTAWSVDGYLGYDDSATDSEEWLHYFIMRAADGSSNYAQVMFYYNSAVHGVPTPIKIRGRIYNGGSSSYGSTVYTNVTSFKARIVRAGSTVTLYYDIGSGWVQIHTGSCSSWPTEMEYMNLLYNWDEATTTTSVLWIDEFIVNSGTIYHYYGRKKMAMTDENGTQLPIEIEDLQFRLNRAIMWTKVPTVYSGRDTKIYLYYDHTKTDNTTYVGELGDAASKSVWDSDYLAVYHLENNGVDPSGSNSVEDSTSNVKHGTPNSTPNLVTAKAGRGLNFDSGSTEYVTFSNPPALDGKSAMTVSLIMKSDEAPFTQHRGIFVRGSSGQRTPWLYCNNGSSNIVFQCELADASQPSRTIAISQDTWTAIDFVWTGTELQRYKDGVSAGSSVATNSSTVANTDGFNYIGFMTGYYSFDGILDEIRISKAGRSAAYIKASYHSNWDTLIYYGPEHDYPPSVISGTLYDKYSRPMDVPCEVIVSDLDGQFVMSDITNADGSFEIGVPAAPDSRFVVTFYKEGKYGLDYDIAGAMFMTPVATTSG